MSRLIDVAGILRQEYETVKQNLFVVTTKKS